MDVRQLTLTGGEPFSRDDILEIIRCGLERNMDLTVLTSGRIDGSLIGKIRQLDVELRISFDGVSEETHDYIRGKSNLAEVVRVVEELRGCSRLRLSAHFTVNRLNIREIGKLPYFLQRIGIRDVVVSTIKPTGRARAHPELLLGPELLPLARERVSTISKSPVVSLHRYAERSWSGLACPAAYTKCGITPQGNITPCVFLGEEFVGASIREYSLAQLWNHDDKCRTLRNLTPCNQCFQCSQLATRHGGCRARALYYGGHIADADPHCCALKESQRNESLTMLL